MYRSQELTQLLEREGLYIDGLTPDLTTESIRKTKKFSLVKAEEILSWLQSHKDVTDWVVLDDMDLHNVQVEHHQVKTDQTIGLTLENIKEAGKILSGEFPVIK